MHIVGMAQKVSIYITEQDKLGNKPLYGAIMKVLRDYNCAGVTVIQGMTGFGKNSRANPMGLLMSGSNRPLIIEWVDSPEQVSKVLPQVQAMVYSGLITVEDVKVAQYSYLPPTLLPADTPVGNVMSREVRTVSPETPVAEAVRILIGKVYRALPVVDANNHVIGILTEGDLMQQAQVLTASANETLTEAELSRELASLFQSGQTVRDLMTLDPITTSTDTTVAEVISLMNRHGIKRVPVVDESDVLVGIVSRVNVLRAMARPAVDSMPRDQLPPGSYQTVGEVMLTNVPRVQADALLAEVVGRLVNHTQRRVVVVDRNQRVVGIITDGDLIEHATDTERPQILNALMRLSQGSEAERVKLSQRTAADVMTHEVVTTTPDTSLMEALRQMLAYHIKRLPVVDSQGRPVGMIGRGGILQALGADSLPAQGQPLD